VPGKVLENVLMCRKNAIPNSTRRGHTDMHLSHSYDSISTPLRKGWSWYKCILIRSSDKICM